MRRKQPVIILMYILFLLVAGCQEETETAVREQSQSLTATPTCQLDVVVSPSATFSPADATVPTIEAVPTIEPTPTAQPPKQTIEDNQFHPYLLFNNQDIVQFKWDIAQPGSFRQKLFTALRDYLREDESSSLLASAFFSLLTDDDPSHLIEARSLLLNVVSQDCWDADENSCKRSGGAASTLGIVSLAYDWLYPQLSTSDRDLVKARIAKEVCRYYEAFTYGINNTSEGWNNWWTTDYTQNHFHTATGGMVLGALAIKDDYPPTCTVTNKDGQRTIVSNQQILELAVQKMGRNYLIFDRISDGSYPEGDSYMAAYSGIYLNALWATQRLLSPSPNLIKEERLRMFPLFYLYNAPQGQLWNQLTNYGDYFTSSRENYPFPRDLHLSATVNRNRVAAWMAEQYYYDKAGKVRIPPDNDFAAANVVLDFIFVDPALTPQSPVEANLDLSYHATDWEGVLMRSDWSETAVAAAIKVGPPGGHTAYNIARSNYQLDQWVGGGQEPTEFEFNVDHMHPDANGIYLYANKTFLLPEMPGYGDEKTPWGKYTSSHNTILVSDDQGRMRGQIQGDAIGGIGLGYSHWHPGFEQFWNISPPENEVGIIEHAATQGYDYSLGQATSAYWPELGLKRFHRHVLFIRGPGYLLVVDDLDATLVKTYDWMGHSTGTVTQEGTWLKVYADNDQRLGLAVLSPSTFTFAKPANEWEGLKLEDIYRFRYVSARRTMYEWRIRQTCQTCRFMTLLVPTDETRWLEKPTVTKLADTDQLAAVQVNFKDRNRSDTLAISLSPGQTLMAGALTFDGRAAAVEKVGSTVRRALLVHGFALKEGDITLIQNLPDSSFVEVQYTADELILRSPNPTGVTLFAPGITKVSLQRVDENNVVTISPMTFARNGDYITLNVTSG